MRQASEQLRLCEHIRTELVVILREYSDSDRLRKLQLPARILHCPALRRAMHGTEAFRGRNSLRNERKLRQESPHCRSPSQATARRHHQRHAHFPPQPRYSSTEKRIDDKKPAAVNSPLTKVSICSRCRRWFVSPVPSYDHRRSQQPSCRCSVLPQ